MRLAFAGDGMKNIVLIGFMGCGKTTVARALAKKMNLGVVDMDAQIEKRAGCSINEIFASWGEQGFREMEHAMLKECMALENTVISTGGGVIERSENIPILKQCGLVVYLDVPFRKITHRLQGDKTRPLFRRDTAKALYDSRQDKYRQAADVCIEDKSAKQAVEQIEELVKDGTCKG